MCGIAGLIGKKTASTPAEMARMLQCITHRGPDYSGQWQEDRLILGHCRLAILDLSAHGNQPMNYGGRYILVFNGEIYNYKELRAELCQKGYRFHTETDSEVIPAAYDCWGEACQERMNGMWAFALYDKKQRKLFCSRDRFGIKPFYYMVEPERFVFGSEIKQLLAVMHNKPRANRTALEVFLAVGYMDYSQDTMFDNILQLRGGHCFTYDLGNDTFQIRRWFNLLDTCDKLIDEESAIHQFRALFDAAIRRHLRADVEIGSCLSGGLDSSAIVCAVNQILQSATQQKHQYAISSCFSDERYDERPYIAAVLKQCPIVEGIQVFPRMESLLEDLNDIIWHMDEPFGSTSIFAQWNVFKKAQEIGLKVMLDGQGADEQLAGYNDYYKAFFIWLFRNGHWASLLREIRAYAKLRLKLERKSQLRFMLITLFEGLAPAWLYERIYQHYHQEVAGNKWLHLSKESSETLWSIKRHFINRDLKEFTCAFMEIGLPELLHYEDRNSMAFSVESRVPFLDADLACGLMSMPFSVKIKNGQTKWVMRAALKDVLPEKIQNRFDKMGFVTPENEWIVSNRTEIEAFLRKAARQLSPIIDEDKIITWFRSKEDFQVDSSKVWRVLCASQWMERFQIQLPK